MSSSTTAGGHAVPAERAHAHADARATFWLVGALALALILYYFVGIDQGATSVFGSDMHVHEFVHDSRHFLGFPCH